MTAQPARHPEPPLLEVRGLRKTFSSKGMFTRASQVCAARDVSFQIDRGEAVNKRRSRDMMKLLARPIATKPNPKVPFDQVFGFLGEGLPTGSQLWSKAGWMSVVKHDAAIVKLPGGGKFNLVVFTRGEVAAGSTKILPFISRKVASALTRGLRDRESA